MASAPKPTPLPSVAGFNVRKHFWSQAQSSVEARARQKKGCTCWPGKKRAVPVGGGGGGTGTGKTFMLNMFYEKMYQSPTE